MTVINTEIAETVEITSNGMHDVAKYTSANVAVPKVINSLPITPSTSAQTFTATGGVDGYSPVSVSAVTAAIDANITASNIKSGVSILGVSGNVVELNGSTTSINPSTSPQTVSPISPSNGFTSVTVPAVTSSIDANITAGNIKDGVTILGVTGNYQGGGGGGGKTLTYVASNGRLVPNNTTMFDFTGVRVIDQPNMFDRAYQNSSISGAISFGDLEELFDYMYAFEGAFTNAQYITSADMSNLMTAGGYSCNSMFAYASSLASIDFSMLQTVGDTPFANFISGTQITDLYFPSFKPSQSETSCFIDMLVDTDGVTLHLPNDIQSIVENLDGYPDFGGMNASFLYDLPSTAVRYGSNGAAYKRYPKYDTATALAWYNVYPAQRTPSYTSGLTDPQVGDNIYSNAACTTVETTVASIETLE